MSYDEAQLTMDGTGLLRRVGIRNDLAGSSMQPDRPGTHGLFGLFGSSCELSYSAVLCYNIEIYIYIIYIYMCLSFFLVWAFKTSLYSACLLEPREIGVEGIVWNRFDGKTIPQQVVLVIEDGGWKGRRLAFTDCKGS